LDADGHARQTLREVVSGYGTAGLDDARLLGTLLPDMLGGSPRETKLILAAASVGTARLLIERRDRGMPAGASVADVAAILAADSMIEGHICQWIVNEYASVLEDRTLAPPVVSASPSGGAVAVVPAVTTADPGTAPPPTMHDAPTAAAGVPAGPGVDSPPASDGDDRVWLVESRPATARGRLLTVVGILLVVLALVSAYLDLDHYINSTIYHLWRNRPVAVVAPMLAFGIPGTTLIAAGLLRIASRSTKTAVRVDRTGLAVLTTNPGARSRRRAWAWLLSPVFLLVGGVIYFVVWPRTHHRGWVLFAALGLIPVAIVIASVTAARGRAVERAWASLLYQRPSASRADPLEVAAYTWPEIAEVAIQPNGLSRGRVLAVRPASGRAATAESVFQPLLSGANVIAVARLGRLSIPAGPVEDGLRAHAGPRLRQRIG